MPPNPSNTRTQTPEGDRSRGPNRNNNTAANRIASSAQSSRSTSSNRDRIRNQSRSTSGSNNGDNGDPDDYHIPPIDIVEAEITGHPKEKVQIFKAANKATTRDLAKAVIKGSDFMVKKPWNENSVTKDAAELWGPVFDNRADIARSPERVLRALFLFCVFHVGMVRDDERYRGPWSQGQYPFADQLIHPFGDPFDDTPNEEEPRATTDDVQAVIADMISGDRIQTLTAKDINLISTTRLDFVVAIREATQHIATRARSMRDRSVADTIEHIAGLDYPEIAKSPDSVLRVVFQCCMTSIHGLRGGPACQAIEKAINGDIGQLSQLHTLTRTAEKFDISEAVRLGSLFLSERVPAQDDHLDITDLATTWRYTVENGLETIDPVPDGSLRTMFVHLYRDLCRLNILLDQSPAARIGR